MNKAGIYIRISNETSRSQSTSLQTQEAVCLKKAADIGATVVCVESDDGVSGARYLTRPGIQAILKRAETKEINLVVIANFSRYSRDAEHQQVIKKRIERAGARLVFCDIDLPDTPEGNLAFGIFGTFAEYERMVIRQRTSRGRRQKAINGEQPSRARSPYGYYIPTKNDIVRGDYPAASLGQYIIVPDHAAIVRRIFSLVATSGHSLGEIAQALNQDNIPTPRGSRVWHRETIRTILRNPVHKGEAAFGRTQAIPDERYKQSIKSPTEPETWTTITCEPIVSVETWEAAQIQLERNRTIKSGRPSSTMWLSGLLRCPSCGATMYSTTNTTPTKVYSYYKCHRAKPDVSARCYQPTIRVELVDKEVKRGIKALSNDSTMAKALEAFRKRGRQSALPMVSWQQEWDKLERKQSAAYKARIEAIEAGVEEDGFKDILADIKATRDRLLLSKPKTSVIPNQIDWLPKFARNIDHLLENPKVSPREVNTALKMVVGSVNVKEDVIEMEVRPSLLVGSDQNIPTYMTISIKKSGVIEIKSIQIT